MIVFINRVDKVIWPREGIRVLMFRALALPQSESDKFDERLMFETSALESLYGGQITLSTLSIKPNIYFFQIQLKQMSLYHFLHADSKGIWGRGQGELVLTLNLSLFEEEKC